MDRDAWQRPISSNAKALLYAIFPIAWSSVFSLQKRSENSLDVKPKAGTEMNILDGCLRQRIARKIRQRRETRIAHVEARKRSVVETQMAMLRVDQAMHDSHTMSNDDLRDLRRVSNTSCDMDDDMLDDCNESFGMHVALMP